MNQKLTLEKIHKDIEDKKKIYKFKISRIKKMIKYKFKVF